MKNNDRLGKVYICGAGPGDPKLLTIKAFELLKHADASNQDPFYLILYLSLLLASRLLLK